MWFDKTSKRLARSSELDKGTSHDRVVPTTRRRFIRRAAATAAGLGAAAYVAPTMDSFGVPAALAVSPGGCPDGRDICGTVCCHADELCHSGVCV